MKTLSEYAGENIKFYQPSFFKRLHELKAGEELVGSIQQKGFFGMRWDVMILNKNWEMIRPSIWKRTVEIRQAGYEMPFANFVRERIRDKGTVTLPMGAKLKIVPHLFRGFTEITDENDECLVKIVSKIALRDKAEVLIEKKSELIDKYPWVIILAYIITIEQRHQAAHASA
jgi:hypothetical protein